MVLVIRDGSHDAVNDVYYPRVSADDVGPHYPTVKEIRLSQLRSIGCKDRRKVGWLSR